MSPITIPATIPATVFEELAAGYGDERAMRLLRATQKAQTRLLLRALADKSQESRPPLEFLAETADVDTGAVQKILEHPLLAQWAMRCLSHRSNVAFAYWVAAAAAARARRPFELRLTVDDGALVLPTLGEAIGLGGTVATVIGERECLIISCEHTRVEVPWPFTSATDHWRPLSVVEEAGWSVVIEDADPHRDCFGVPVTGRLSSVRLSEFQGRLRGAWRILEREHPRHAGPMRESLRAIVPLQDPSGGGTVSSSARGVFGAVAVSLSIPEEDLALQLLHEYMHMKLWAVMDLVRLHSDDGVPHHFAPWRSDPRSVPALLQGTYAHLGVSEFWRARRRSATGQQRLRAELEYGFWLSQTMAAVWTLLSSGELTDEGVRFVKRLGMTLEEWEREPVEAREVAHDLVRAATVSWRLRNTRPSQHFVHMLTQTRAAGLPCPSRLEEPRVIPANAEGWQPSALEQLIRDRYTNSETASCEDPTHQAFFNGDYDSASSVYRRLLRREPARHDVWCGLSIALARTGEEIACDAVTARPDLVFAVTSSTGEDPVAVAQWLVRYGC